MKHYITLFDRNYLAKGLALYKSLEEHSIEPFELYIVALDDFTRKYLLNYFEKKTTHSAKILSWNFLPTDIPEKPVPYNFFLLASEVTLALMKAIRKPITYLDSDIYFFQDPLGIHNYIGKKDVAIVPHRFPPHDFERLSPNGLYNVSFIYFANTQIGIETLTWWNQMCRKQCDAQSCGDQKYLNYFVDIAGDGLCILDPIGIGAGPWNTYTYEVGPGPTLNLDLLMFYHYHEFKRDATLPLVKYTLTGYPTTEKQREFIYAPYMEIIENFQSHIDKKAEDWFA